MEETPEKQPTGFKLFRDFGVRAFMAVLLITGFIISVIVAIYLDNKEMITTIATIYSPAIIAVIVFYFRGSEIRDM